MLKLGGGREETASRNDGTFFQGTDATVGDSFSRNDSTFIQCTDVMLGDGFNRNDGTFLQDTDATVGDGFAPLGPPLLPWGDRIGRGQTEKLNTDIATTRSKRPKGRFGPLTFKQAMVFTTNLNADCWPNNKGKGAVLKNTKE